MRDRDHLVHVRDQLGKHLAIAKIYGVPLSLVAKKTPRWLKPIGAFILSTGNASNVNANDTDTSYRVDRSLPHEIFSSGSSEMAAARFAPGLGPVARGGT